MESHEIVGLSGYEPRGRGFDSCQPRQFFLLNPRLRRACVGAAAVCCGRLRTPAGRLRDACGARAAPPVLRASTSPGSRSKGRCLPWSRKRMPAACRRSWTCRPPRPASRRTRCQAVLFIVSTGCGPRLAAPSCFGRRSTNTNSSCSLCTESTTDCATPLQTRSRALLRPCTVAAGTPNTLTPSSSTRIHQSRRRLRTTSPRVPVFRVNPCGPDEEAASAGAFAARPGCWG